MSEDTATKEKYCKFCEKAFATSSDHWKTVRKIYLECKAQAKATRAAKSAARNLKNYGTERPRKSKEFHKLVSEKRAATMQKKYGGNAMQVPEFKEKQRVSLMASLGVEVPSKSELVKEKIRQTNIEKYGVETNLQIPEVVEKASKSRRDRFSILLIDGTRLRDFCDDRQISRAWAYKVFKHGGEETLRSYADSYSKRTSNLELEFMNIMRDFGTISLFNRHPAKGVPYRPDFMLSRGDKKLYVNVDGMYFHCEARQPNAEYHRWMREAFEAAGLRLMQFTGAELMQSPDIIRSMIRSYFGENERVFARNCGFHPISSPVAAKFFEDNHLMGAHAASKSWGLYQGDLLVACMSVRRRGDSFNIERFANRMGTTVVGGFSRLVENIPKSEGIKTIISYCDLRYATGASYLASGFDKIGETLGFTWTDGVNIFNRLKCRANMDDRMLPEAAHAAEMKLFKLFDAGQAKYLKVLK